MRKISKSVQSRLAQRAAANTTGHPDANILSAFVENRLDGWERAVILEHLADCTECREYVALASARAETEPAATIEFPRRRFSPVWGWAAGVAAMICVFAIAWQVRARFQPTRPQSVIVSSKAAPPLPPPIIVEGELKDLKIRPQKPKRLAMSQRASKPLATGLPLPAPAAAPAIPQSPEVYTREPRSTQASAEDRTATLQLQLRAGTNMRAPQPLAASHTLWSINASPALASNARGTVQRSTDGGKTWDIVPISDDIDFRAISAMGSDVWAGGSGGVLFHSSDGGMHWIPVQVTQNAASITGTVVSIETRRWPIIQVTTSTGETWTSTDGGHNWTRS
ncbi:MAG: zf-HC2 domain-containing protein [Acidobacteriaceae bacterium]|nr:zf-HC2 domain-containing protein [Acidobacteriaceae bacterium]MBV9780899.1 zf-HC2 domain-containing protein [Acidobacteriaceae bacterium]